MRLRERAGLGGSTPKTSYVRMAPPDTRQAHSRRVARLTEEEGNTMPGWQSELETLLSQLHVSLEPGRQQSSPSAHGPASLDGERDTVVPDDSTDATIPWDLDTQPVDDLPADGDEVSAVSREIEATVRRVISMARAGQMEGALRDDVVFVLQALTRPIPYDKSGNKRHRRKSDEASQEWQLASAAAVLRFCRIVLRLTAALTRDVDQ